MRNNGGWNNWSMDIIAVYKCKDLNEARQKEQEHFVALNATLNSVEPFPLRFPKLKTPNKYHAQHIPIQINNTTVIYNCEKCYFITSNKKDYGRHLLSRKHMDLNPKTCETAGGDVIITPRKPIKPAEYPCQFCNRFFKSRTTIYQHKVKCQIRHQEQSHEHTDTNYVTDSLSVAPVAANPADDIICADDKITITKDTVMTLLKDNQEMLKMLKAIVEQRNVNIPINNTTNSNTTTPSRSICSSTRMVITQ